MLCEFRDGLFTADLYSSHFLFPLLRNLKIGLDEQNELYRELTVLQGLSSIITHMRVGMMGGKEVKGGGD